MANQQIAILVVEDDQSILFNLQLMLKFNDFEVFTASDGSEALDLLRTNEKKPHIILSDIMMPNLDGYGFLEAILNDENFNKIPFIFISAKDPQKDVLDKNPELSYVPKPINETILLTTIKEKLEKNQVQY